MTAQKKSLPSFATFISVLSIVLYCAGFLRVELELNKHKERLNALENAVAGRKPPTSEPNHAKTTRNVPDFRPYKLHRNRRNADGNITEAENTAKMMQKMSKFLSELKPHLCHSKSSTCPSGAPGPPGLPGPRGRRGQKGKTGNKGDQGIMGSPGKSGKQGIMGPVGPQGEGGPEGQKGHMGPGGMPGAKGEPGESTSAPTVAVSPTKLAVNEGGSASFQCSASGNPEPAVVWSKLNSQSEISQSAVSGGRLRLRNVKRSDSGVYQCSAENILGKDQAVAQLEVNVHPFVSLHPGPLYVIEESNATLPTCHVTGHPTPVVTWRKLFGQLPQGRVQSNSSVLKIFDVRKADSADYVCTATNLLGSAVQKTLLVVVSFPRLTVKPPAKVVATVGDTLTLNCSAIGDPQPVISWKRQGAQLPVGRSYLQINGALVIRDIKTEDAGNYICVAKSAGVFAVETGSSVEVFAQGRGRPGPTALKIRSSIFVVLVVIFLFIVVTNDCSDVLKSGHTQSGVYSVNPDGKGSFTVYCDMRTDGGGWTVFQRRQDGSVDFYRGWNNYKSGFGQLTAEFWLGNDKIHRLTASRPSSLRVELEDWNGVRVYAKYGRFSIGDEQAQYRLELSSYSGTAGDSLAHHNNMAFSTKDRDNDRWSGDCAVQWTGAWWYGICHESNLNGKYLGNKNDNHGARWYHFRGTLSLKFTEMKLRPSS